MKESGSKDSDFFCFFGNFLMRVNRAVGKRGVYLWCIAPLVFSLAMIMRM